MAVEGQYDVQSVAADTTPGEITKPSGHPDSAYYFIVIPDAAEDIEIVDDLAATQGILIPAGSATPAPFGPYRLGGERQFLRTANPVSVRVTVIS